MKRIIIILCLIVMPIGVCRSDGWFYAAPAAGGSGTWVYSNSHTPTSGDSTATITNTVHVGGYITAPAGTTKITKLRWAVVDGASARNVRICVYPYDGGDAIGGGTGSTPGSSGGFLLVDTGTLNISISEETTYVILASVSDDLDGYYSAVNGRYSINSYSGSACVDDVTPLEDTGYGHCVGAYFE